MPVRYESYYFPLLKKDEKFHIGNQVVLLPNCEIYLDFSSKPTTFLVVALLLPMHSLESSHFI